MSIPTAMRHASSVKIKSVSVRKNTLLLRVWAIVSIDSAIHKLKINHVTQNFSVNIIKFT